MPLIGFLYMVGTIKQVVDNPKLQEQLEKYVEAGLLPKLGDGNSEPLIKSNLRASDSDKYQKNCSPTSERNQYNYSRVSASKVVNDNTTN